MLGLWCGSSWRVVRRRWRRARTRMRIRVRVAAEGRILTRLLLVVLVLSRSFQLVEEIGLKLLVMLRWTRFLTLYKGTSFGTLSTGLGTLPTLYYSFNTLGIELVLYFETPFL
jgi:hypothetical protein